MGYPILRTGTNNHSNLLNLGADDHPQYALADGSRGNFAAINHTHVLDDLTNVSLTAPTNDEVLTYVNGSWVNSPIGGANLGSGITVYKDKTSNILNFKTLSTGSAKVVIIDDLANNLVLFDIDESQIQHNLLSGVGTYTHNDLDNHLNSTSNPHNTSLTLLTDVNLVGQSVGDLLIYNGSTWVNISPGNDNDVLTVNVADPLKVQWKSLPPDKDEKVKVSVNDTTAGYLGEKVIPGNGILTSIANGGANEQLEIRSEVYLTTIDGNTFPVFDDSIRGKTLSVETMNYLWAEAALSDNDWIQIGHASDADSGYVMPFNGTIVGIMAQCENTQGNAKEINLYIDGANLGSIGNFPGVGGDESFYNNSLNIDFNAGQKIRLRAGTTGGTIRDTNVQLRIKWRV